MKFSISYASRKILDKYPNIEDKLLDYVFEIDRKNLWISDESDIIHLGKIKNLQKNIHDVFGISINKYKLSKMLVGELVILISNSLNCKNQPQ